MGGDVLESSRAPEESAKGIFEAFAVDVGADLRFVRKGKNDKKNKQNS